MLVAVVVDDAIEGVKGRLGVKEWQQRRGFDEDGGVVVVAVVGDEGSLEQ